MAFKQISVKQAHDALEEVEVEVVARLAGEVDVAVDEAGEESHIAEVDHLGTRGNRDVDSGDLVAGHDDRGVADDLVGSAVEEPRGFQRDRLRLGCEGGGEEEERESTECVLHRATE